ncbi:NAD(P)-dependent oxidoreductase [Geodermatophilus africanus]|nr:NAD(P)-dependent oxidoreductase [Geodermatophilus africanus]
MLRDRAAHRRPRRLPVRLRRLRGLVPPPRGGRGRQLRRPPRRRGRRRRAAGRVRRRRRHARAHPVPAQPPRAAPAAAAGWQRTVGTDLAGARLGVVGLGRLGTRVARIGQAFGMDVVAWSQHLTDERAAEAGVRRVDRDEVFATADVVTVHLVLSDRTRGLVGRDELARMQPGAILVNTSRGPVVDEAALLEALAEGRLAGAGLDVYDREPLPPDSPLRTAPRTVLTPHLGYVTRDTYRVFYGDAVEDVAAWLRGEPVRVLTPA